MVKILDGKILAQKLKDALKKEVADLKKVFKDSPVLASVLVGDDKGSLAYVNSQKKNAEEIGVLYQLIKLPKDISQQEFVKTIKGLNADSKIHGIIIQQPVPSQIDYTKIAALIDPSKDIEGMNVSNLGRFILGGNKLVPCTAASVMEHIKSTGVDFKGKEAVVVGRSAIVGKPLIFLLLEENLTVTVCHSKTPIQKLEEHVRLCDVVVAAVGKPGFIKGEWIKKGAIVIDVGINKVGEKILGDVEFDKAKERAGFITPVPGGVGPLTVVSLMKNCIEAFKFQQKKTE